MNDVKVLFGLKGGPKTPVLDIHQWHVDRGERIAIIGPSGSGKSTLFHLLSGLIVPDEGQLHIENYALHALSEAARDEYRSRMLGYILQDFHLIPSLTAAQNVELMLDAGKIRNRKSLLTEWFTRLGLKDRMNHVPAQLSRGQQQRVAMIRALINRPKLVLADEPTGSLDVETARNAMSLLLDLCAAEGTTLLTVTHDLQLSELFPKVLHIKAINRTLQAPLIQRTEQIAEKEPLPT